MRISTVVGSTLLWATVLTACATTDGYTVACDVYRPLPNGGTIHLWCSEDYGVPAEDVAGLQGACVLANGVGTGTVVDACSTAGVTAMCTSTLPTPDGELTAVRAYFYTGSVPDGGPAMLESCPYAVEP
jgi:hypothetical protein